MRITTQQTITLGTDEARDIAIGLRHLARHRRHLAVKADELRMNRAADELEARADRADALADLIGGADERGDD